VKKRSRLLYPLSFIYGLAATLRNTFYDKGLLRSCSPPVPLISVGNLSVGGTGKTSFTLYLAELLKEKRVCILLRGYKRKKKGYRVVSSYGELRVDSWRDCGDEAFMLAKLLPFASVVVSENRCEGVKRAFRELEPEVFILDDAFQHRRIRRDLDILLLKREDLNDSLLPYGNLREPLSSLSRADILVLSYQEVKPFELKTAKPVFKMYREFHSLLDTNFREVPLSFLEGKEVVLFSGLGDNEQFLRSAEKLGIRIKNFIALPDHYGYENFSLKEGELYLTTPKDLVKLPQAGNLFALNFKVKVEGEEKLRELIYRIFC